MKTLNNCNFCGGSDFSEVFELEDKNFNIQKKFRLVKCNKCGLLFLNPQPDWELADHYPREYYSFGQLDKKSFKTGLKLFLYNLYFNPAKKSLLLKMVFLPLKFYIRGTKIIPEGRLLDIGSGSGQFLYEMGKFNMELYGVEPGDFDVKTANKEKLNIFKGSLEEVRFPTNFFDVVTMNHVLEHVPNPSEVIKEIYRILKKNGQLIIGVPNNNSWAYRLFRNQWYQFDAPRHLFDFSDKCLAKELTEQRFTVKKIRYNSRPSQFSVSLIYRLGLDHRKQKIFLAMLDLIFLPITYLANIFRKGDQIELYCTK